MRREFLLRRSADSGSGRACARSAHLLRAAIDSATHVYMKQCSHNAAGSRSEALCSLKVGSNSGTWIIEPNECSRHARSVQKSALFESTAHQTQHGFMGASRSSRRFSHEHRMAHVRLSRAQRAAPGVLMGAGSVANLAPSGGSSPGEPWRAHRALPTAHIEAAGRPEDMSRYPCTQVT